MIVFSSNKSGQKKKKNVFNVLRENKCQPKIQHPDKLPFTIEGELKVFFKLKLGFLFYFIFYHSQTLTERTTKGCTREGN